MSNSGESAGNDKRHRILDAAQNLFLRYGVKRTALDDVVREAGIAKGTLYLYFDSKDALFAAVAEQLCAEVLGKAEEAIASSSSSTSRIVECLDAYIGSMHRLTAQSPHIAELTESKEALAAAIYGAFNRKMRDLLRKVLRDSGIERGDAVDMFFAAAIGTLKTGDSAAKPYRARLTALTEVLVAGLRHTPR
ncbi:MAG TPA: TetR/AcrR family transcriptional regulator [Candidatus Acidoferrum sp.]|nr:TetR/AcrR family transcriptional regulator [Candidatus Acidoferrum sp.]